MLTRQQSKFTLAAGAEKAINLDADYILFQEADTALELSLNDGEYTTAFQGSKHQSPAGEHGVQRVKVRNPSAGALPVTLIYGLGQCDVIGSVTLSGTVPLATGASTGAKQDAQTALLTASNAANVETPDLVTLGATANQNFANCRSLAVVNTGAGNVTVTIGANVRTLPPGYGAAWEVTKPFNTLATVNVATGAGGAALIAYTT